MFYFKGTLNEGGALRFDGALRLGWARWGAVSVPHVNAPVITGLLLYSTMAVSYTSTAPIGALVIIMQLCWFKSESVKLYKLIYVQLNSFSNII